jgi:hypothetical protein
MNTSIACTFTAATQVVAKREHKRGVLMTNQGISIFNIVKTACVIAIIAGSVSAEQIFYESFESPVVSGDVDTTPTGWASAVANKAGLNNGTMTGKTGSQFARIDDYPTPPAYNGALTTTASILTNKLTSCFHYTLTCDTTGLSTTDAVTIDLLAGATVVASVTKKIATINNLSANTATIDFIPQADHPNLDQTLAIRLRQTAGAHNQHCYFDNLSLAAVDTAIDTDPPTPNPMTWVQAPVPAGNLSMLMTCAVASDINFVEYCFTNTVNGHSSGWMSVTTWRDTGLEHGVQYSYMAKARDTSFNKNETGWTTIASATADAGVLFYDSFERPVVSSATSVTDPYQWQDLSTGANSTQKAGLGYMVGSGYTDMKGNQAAWLNVYNATPVLKTTTSNLDMELVEGGKYTLTFLAADTDNTKQYTVYGDLLAGTNVILTASKSPSSKVFSSNLASNTVTVAAGTLGIKEPLSIRLRVTGGDWDRHSYVDDLRLYAVLPPPKGTLISFF